MNNPPLVFFCVAFDAIFFELSKYASQGARIVAKISEFVDDSSLLIGRKNLHFTSTQAMY